MFAAIATVGGALLGADSASKASYAQRKAAADAQAADAAAKKKLDEDIKAQRALADKAFEDYQQGLITYADAQKAAATAMQGVQQGIADSQLSDVAKMQEMAKFTPYGITSGTGTSFVNPQTGQAGFNLSPELQQYQQGLYGQALQAQQGIAATPQEAAKTWYEQQQGLLAPGRAQEDVQNRASQLQRGTLGLGVSSEAAGFGEGGGLFNAQQASVDRARAQADAALAAQATQQGQAQAANQLALAQGLFGAGYAPEQYGMQNLKTGVDIGNITANQGARQAQLYSQSMSPYYTSLLGVAETGQNAALYNPQAVQTGIQTAYNRQQDQLAGLLGYQNQLYQPTPTAPATVPGSAYAGAALGSQLMGYGMNQMAGGASPNWWNNIQQGYTTSPMYGGYGYGTGYTGMF